MSKRFALLIGNGHFADPAVQDLATPAHDVEQLAEMLKTLGDFQVTPWVDCDSTLLRREIARFYQRRQRDDLLLLYYSGHGLKHEYSGELYLAGAETEAECLHGTALDAHHIRHCLGQCDSRRKVVVLDCCYSGLFAGAKDVPAASAGAREALEAKGGYGQVIMTASNAVEYSWEGKQLLGAGSLSVYTHYLVDGLRSGAADLDGDGKVEVQEWHDYAYGQVLKLPGAKQTPLIWKERAEGRLWMARRARSALIPATVSDTELTRKRLLDDLRRLDLVDFNALCSLLRADRHGLPEHPAPAALVRWMAGQHDGLAELRRQLQGLPYSRQIQALAPETLEELFLLVEDVVPGFPPADCAVSRLAAALAGRGCLEILPPLLDELAVFAGSAVTADFAVFSHPLREGGNGPELVRLPGGVFKMGGNGHNLFDYTG